MKNPCVGILFLLSLALAAPAAERLKVQPGAENLEYFRKNRAARLTYWEHPQYPPEPAAEWVQQSVRIAFEVDVDGRVLDARVMGGADKFRDAAVMAVSHWKFEPELVDGRPTLVSKEVRVVFTPKGTPKKSPRDESMNPYSVENPEIAPPGDPANDEARYPAALLPRRLSGEVELIMSVDREGRVDGVKILRATYPEFLSSALETLAGWQLRPAHRGKVPEPGQKQAVLTFFPVDEEGQPRRTEWLERNGIALREGPAGVTAWFDRPPTATAMVDPVYPRELLQSGTAGTARVNFSVDLAGRVVGVRVDEATAPEFGEALAAAIAAWQFEPLQRNGESSGADLTITWRFKAPDPGSAEQRLLGNLGTERAAVRAQELDRPLFPLFTRLPVYPAGRLESREGGEAQVEVVIDREGRVRLPRIRKASQPEFGWAAATAVTQWLFETPRKGGEPVDVRVIIPMQFKPPEPVP
jgi:TonB family protein